MIARAVRRPVWLLVVLGLSAAIASVAIAASHRAGLDTSFGDEGVVDLRAALAPAGSVPEGDREGSPSVEARAFAAADDGSAYVVAGLRGCEGRCANGPYLDRVGPTGRKVVGFGGPGGAGLPAVHTLAVMTDAAGRAVVGALEKGDVVLRRFTRAGKPDPGFGDDGTVRLNCDCFGYPQLRLLRSPGGRILVDVNVYRAPDHVFAHSFRADLYRLLPDGRPDRTLGGSGSALVRFQAPELPSSVVVDPSGGILFGGSTQHQIYLERISATGRPDRGFTRTVTSSARRLNRLGEFPTLAAALPGPHGGVAVVGSSDERQGYLLRLRPDGRLERGFGARGLRRLPFDISTAATGIDGAVFAVGRSVRHGRYRAFRILSNGRPDPAFGGAGGILIPAFGLRAHLAAAGPGRMLVFDNGSSFCRSGCAPEPTLTRFLE